VIDGEIEVGDCDEVMW